MIKTLTLTNFQTHENARFEFSKGVNIVSGSSDSGKTAIFRAFLWAFENRPLGNAFIRHGTDYAEVGIENERGKLTRYKSDSENYYILNGEKYEALKGGMPPSIKNYFNISDVNIQQQLDAHFLIAESAGEVARFFNRALHLDDIDTALKWIESEKRASKAELKHTEIASKKMEKELQKYAGVELLEAQVEELDNVIYEMTDVNVALVSLATSVEEYQEINGQIDAANKQIQAFGTVHSLYEQIIDTNISMRELETGVHLKREIVKEYRDACREAGKHIPDITGSIDKLQKYDSKIRDCQRNEKSLNESIKQYILAKNTIEDLNSELEYHTALMPEICPLCGKSL